MFNFMVEQVLGGAFFALLGVLTMIAMVYLVKVRDSYYTDGKYNYSVEPFFKRMLKVCGATGVLIGIICSINGASAKGLWQVGLLSSFLVQVFYPLLRARPDRTLKETRDDKR